ncbi:MAG: hypothetical protein M0Z98_10100 [Actinomycetales bacterium]|nr:hypothetical protein [Actinomycetales bacterium]
MSTDHGPGAPSFGDLFEDPDAPDLPPPTPAEAAAAEPAAPGVAVPADARPAVPAEATPADADDRAAHDLDHESAEAAHLVAGFESPDDDAGAPVEEQPGTVSPAGEPVPPLVVAPAAPGGPVTVEPGAPVTVAPVARAWDGTVDPAVSSAPAGRVDTGRLYRSAGAEGPATLDAIPAIDPEHAPGRRVEVVAEKPVRVPSAETGLTYSGVVVVVGAVTVLVAFAEALLRHEIGWMTGVALLASSVYAALVVRRADIWAAVVVPPLAFLAAALTAGQLTLDKSGSLLIREGFSLFRTLATNAPWILGTTAVCLVIVLLRRRRP